jgi:hypothetical protein
MLAAWVERTPDFPNDFNAKSARRLVKRSAGSGLSRKIRYIIHHTRALAFHAVEQIRGNRNQLYNKSFFRYSLAFSGSTNSATFVTGRGARMLRRSGLKRPFLSDS